MIDVCSKKGSFVMDLSASTSMYSFSRNSFTISSSKKHFGHLSPYKQHSQALPKPWAPHLGFVVKYGGFCGGVGAFR
jgi:hypothetical protein